jgi:ferredoxin--NADP+ reductase
MVVKTLQEWAIREPGSRSRRLHLHFLQAPVEVLGDDHVTGLRTERTELTGDGNVRGTGEFQDWPVQAVYRAVGYLSSNLADLPFDQKSGTVPHEGGRVLDLDDQIVPGVYVTGWIKRGPIGLIGHTKGDALETVTNLLADAPGLSGPAAPDPAAVVEFLDQRQVPFTTLEGWGKLDSHEIALGVVEGRERIKVVDRDTMISISRL